MLGRDKNGWFQLGEVCLILSGGGMGNGRIGGGELMTKES